jgi:hypothetical protein
MLLTTRHPVEFDIVKDVADLKKSHILDEFFDNDKVFTNAYKWLFNIIDTGPYIWCYVKGSHLVRSHGEEYQEWTLDVPKDDCLIINEEVWGLVINQYPYFDIQENITDEEYGELYKRYEPIKEKTWLDSIFKVDENELENIQVLVKSPVLEKYVIDKKWICELNLEEFDSGITGRSFSTLKQAQQYATIMECGLKARKIQYKTEFSEALYGFSVKIEWDPKTNINMI